jgi:predicted GNAT family acetyltransferase
MTSTGDLERVIDNAAKHRFEAEVEGYLVQLVYRRDGERLVLLHTEVPDALSGRGIGGQLVGAAVEAAIAGHLRVVPVCPFVVSWLHEHPDVAARVKVDWPEDSPRAGRGDSVAER